MGRSKTSEEICLDCGTINPANSGPKGSLTIEILFWVLFIPFGIIYSLWRRLGSREKRCFICKSDSLAPDRSPEGLEAVLNFHNEKIVNKFFGEENADNHPMIIPQKWEPLFVIVIIFAVFGLASAYYVLTKPENDKPAIGTIKTTSNEVDFQIGYDWGYIYGYDHASFGHGLPTEVGFSGIAKSRFPDSGARNQQAFAKGIKQGLIDGYNSYQR